MTVVSFMVAGPFSLGCVVVRFDRTAAPISSVAAQFVRPIHSPPEHGPRVGDVVLLNGHREHRRALSRVRSGAAEGLQRRRQLPALDDVDTAGVDRVRAERDVEASHCPASLFDEAHTARKVGLAPSRLDGEVSCNYDHGRAPILSPPARRAVPLR
ncbi:hypothetical protein ACWPOB_10390 [Rhodococcus sp. 2H158]